MTFNPVSLTKMNVIRCHRIIEYRQTQAFLGLENPMQVTATAPRNFSEIFRGFQR